VKHPRDYLDAAKRRSPSQHQVSEKEVIFEFMLNALRLTDGVPCKLFCERTGISLERIIPLLEKAKERGLLMNDASRICPTELGKQFLNDLVEMFL
jgi:oxygen-independent coproporphyrinogen-3 oxidase